MPETVSSLEERLREKEELVAALTERLEQAAEQLDRVHRMGADRGMRISTGGASLPPDFVEDQKVLMDDMQRLVQQFEDMQAALTLGRIEDQLGELRELLTGGHPAGHAAPGSHGGGHPAGSSGRPPEPSALRTAPSSPTAVWEAMKAQMLGEDPSADEADSQNERDDRETAVRQVNIPEPEDVVIPPVDAPEPIDLDTAGRDELIDAVEQRDEYTAWLIRKLRVAEARRTSVPDWEYLQHAPQELADRVQALEAQLEEKLRLAEVELSVERAKLGREAARLKQLEDNAQKTMKRLGLDMNREPARVEADPDQAEQPKSRWLRMLGIGRDEDGE